MQTLGDRIREYRTSIRMTQSDFANRLGITGASVSAYENGTRLPSYDVLVKIADTLGVTTDELLGRKKNDKVVIEVTNLTPQERHAVQEIINLLEAKEKPQFRQVAEKTNTDKSYRRGIVKKK